MYPEENLGQFDVRPLRLMLSLPFHPRFVLIFHSYCCMYRAQVLILLFIDPDTQSLSAENMFLTSALQGFRFATFM